MRANKRGILRHLANNGGIERVDQQHRSEARQITKAELHIPRIYGNAVCSAATRGHQCGIAQQRNVTDPVAREERIA